MTLQELIEELKELRRGAEAGFRGYDRAKRRQTWNGTQHRLVDMNRSYKNGQVDAYSLILHILNAED